MMKFLGRSEVWSSLLASFASWKVTAGASKRGRLRGPSSRSRNSLPCTHRRNNTRLQHSIYRTLAPFWIFARSSHTHKRHHVPSTRLGRPTQHSTSRPQRFLPSSQEYNTFARTTNLPIQCFDHTPRPSTALGLRKLFQCQRHIPSRTRNAAKGFFAPRK